MAALSSRTSSSVRNDTSGCVTGKRVVVESVAPSGGPFCIDASRRQVFVVGNEAADADSLVSAFVTAALLDDDAVQAIPLAQIPREEFRLRGDALLLFQRAGVALAPDGSPQAMVFADEVNWTAVASLEQRSLVLTDHNQMTEMLGSHFAGRVEAILDHHAPSGSHPEAKSGIVEGLGSTCTLVAERMLAEGKFSEDLAMLLAGVILLDTRNFSPKKLKGTPRDRAALDALKRQLPKGAVPEKAFYKQLMAARKDVSHLSIRDLLLLDLKVVTLRGIRVGVASIFGPMRDIVARAGSPEAYLTESRRLAEARGWGGLVSTFPQDDAGRKGIAFVGASGDGSALCSELEARLQGTPGNLPESVRTSPLFVAQGLAETGFEMAPAQDLQPLRAFTVKGTMTRKTLLPCFMF